MREVIERLEAGIAERVANTVMLPVVDAEALLRLARAVEDAPEGHVDMVCASDAVVVDEIANPDAINKQRVRLLPWGGV